MSDYGNSYHYYMSDSAMTVQHTILESDKTPTVTVELAEKKGSDFDWDNKISIQLTRLEMIEAVRVLIGKAVEVRGSHHGKNKNKSFVFNQKNKSNTLFIGFRQGDEKRKIKLNDAQRLDLTAVVTKRLSAAWKMNIGELFEFLSLTEHIMKKEPLT